MNAIQTTHTVILALAASAAALGAGDCFDPAPCDDLDGNGVADSCQNVETLGSGLIAAYYRDCNDSGGGRSMPVEYLQSALTPTLDLESDPDFPPDGVPDDHFFTRWTGMLVPSESGVHQFRSRSDDGFRLSLDGEYVIESWIDSGSNLATGEYELEAGVPVLLVVEYYENGGSEWCQLSWKQPSASGPEDPYVVIPSSAYVPSTDVDGDGYPDLGAEDCDGDGISDAVAIATGLAEDCDGNCVPDDCDANDPEVIAWYRFQSNPLLVIDSSGNGNHLQVASQVSFSSDRALSVIPRTGDTNFGSAAFRNTGHLRFPDPDGVFALGDQSFTVEAWIKLDQESTTESSEERQYLLQKKNASGDVNAGFQILAQSGNIAAAGNWYGKSSGRSGNELAIRFGNGSISYTLISRLQLVDCADWQHLSVAVDQVAQRVRFEVNGEVEWLDLPGLGHVPGTGALRIGAHSTSSGEIDQLLEANLDELRIIRGVLPLSGMLDRTFSVVECPESCPGDYDGNGTVDGADLTSLLGAWGTVSPVFDLDGTSGVDGADLTILLGVWGACP